MDNPDVEHELCGNCKKEIPHYNYVMHTAHCARNITLCQICKEPFAKNQFDEHKKTCVKSKTIIRKPEVPKTNIENSPYFHARKEVEDQKIAARKEKYLERQEKLLKETKGFSLKETKENISGSSRRCLSSQISDDSDSKHTGISSKFIGASSKHEEVSSNYTGASSKLGALSKLTPTKSVDKITNGTARNEPLGACALTNTNKLLACRYCELELPKTELEEHENYCGSRTDKCLECGENVMYKYKQLHMDTNHGFLKLKDEPGPKPSWDSTTQRSESNTFRSNSPPRRSRPPFRPFDFSDFDPTDYIPPSYRSPTNHAIKTEKGESYKEISRRLDWPAPQPPSRRRNPPTELVIPCEFCDVPIPHEDLIQHETGCRPDLARLRRRSPEPDDYFIAPQPSSPEVELPCEFCADMIPASQLLRHQSTCT